MSHSAEIGRLLSIYPDFEDDVLESVDRAASIHRSLSWEDFNACLPDNQIYQPAHGKPIEVIDIIPQGEIERNLVYRTPTLNALDSNQRNRIGVLALALPNTRVIGIGNPAAPGQKAGIIRFWNSPAVARGNLRAFVDPVFDYLGSQWVESSVHTGHSGGAEMVVAAPELAHKHDQEVPQIIPVEPVATTGEGLRALAEAAEHSMEPLQYYVSASYSDAVMDAREEALLQARGEKLQKLALLRLTNIALFLYMSGNGFESRVDRALMTSPDTRADVVYAGKSEYSPDGLIPAIVQRLMERHGDNRVSGLSLRDERHMFPDDVFLNAAVTLQTLKKLK